MPNLNLKDTRKTTIDNKVFFFFFLWKLLNSLLE